MGLSTDFDSFANIFAVTAVIEAYPAMPRKLQRGDTPAKYWKRALTEMENLIRYNPERFVLALNALPLGRKDAFNANVQNICATLDEDRLFEAGTEPDFHSRRAERISGCLTAEVA